MSKKTLLSELQGKYGELIVGCALTQIIGDGKNRYENVDIEKVEQDFIKEENETRASGKSPLISAAFKTEIIKAASDIAKHNEIDIQELVADDYNERFRKQRENQSEFENDDEIGDDMDMDM